MKKSLIFTLLVILTLVGYSQEYKANIAEAERIKHDTAYFWYQGGSDFETIEDAQEQAEKGLLNKIKNEYKSHIVYVSGDFNAHKETVFSTFEYFIKQERQYLILKEGTEKPMFYKSCKERFP